MHSSKASSRNTCGRFQVPANPLHFSVLAFTSASRSYVTADPGYEAGMHVAKNSGANVAKTPRTPSHAHDVKAMLAAAPDAGLFYVCTPNNPTGTLTPHSDIEYLVEHEPKNSIVLVDEAYIHFSDATTALDLVKADKDVMRCARSRKFMEWPVCAAAWRLGGRI